jgi:HNH endonuclease
MNQQGHEKFRTLLQEMTTIVPGAEYFAITLLERGSRPEYSCYTHFTGWGPRGPDSPFEFRKASIVYPQKMLDLWTSVGQGGWVVNNEAHLTLYVRLGGNALIETSLATRSFPELVNEREVARSGPVGFKVFQSDAREVTAKAPTPAQRMRIIKRDNYRCRVCGESPNVNEHVVLHVHHVRPFSQGGLTDDDNLITLCHTCHTGLDPHWDESLFYLANGHLDRALHELREPEFQASVQRYRQLASKLATTAETVQVAGKRQGRGNRKHGSTHP